MRAIALTLPILCVLAGCASRPAPAAVTPSSDVSSDVASDPSYNPPEESGVVVVENKSDAPVAETAKAKTESEATHWHPREHDSRRGALRPKKPAPSTELPSR